MSQGKPCRLCVKISQDHRCLYNEDGHENENCELIIKYFDPKRLFTGKELELTTVCLPCWRQIYDFYNFQESIYQAQKNLLDNSKDIQIKSEIESPQKGKGYELVENQDINIKIEQVVLPEDECVVNSDINLVKGFTITEICPPEENKYEPIEGASVSLNNEIYLPVKENSTITLPKLELTDVYSNDDSSEDALSDESDDQDVSYMDDDSIEKDDSMDNTPAKENLEGIFAKHTWTRKGSTVSLKESDDFIAQWKPSLHCELCSEPCTTYSLLRQHFHDNHPLEKCYVTCCQQMFYRRYRVEDHIRLHMDANAFKCELCEKDHTSRYYLLSHMRTHHMQSDNGVGKPWKKTRISDKDLDELIAQWMPTLECVVCKKMSPTLKLLQLHFRQHHPQKQFQIECCHRRFKRRNEIEEHMRLHIDPNAFKCDLCYKQFKEERYLHAHMRGFHSKENESKRKNAYQKKMEDVEMDELMAHDVFAYQAKVCLECVVCSEKAPTYSLLRQHFQAEHPQEKFYMLCCQQKLSLRYRIEDHVRLHIDPNTFKCDLCDKLFKEGRYLLAHKRSLHNDTNDEANKPSSRKAKTDEAKTPPNKKAKNDKEIDDLISQWSPNLECVVCKQVCNTLTLLQHHFRENHPQKQFQIECCQRMFKRRYEIEEHIRLHINPDAYKCELCSTRFSKRRNLLQHMRSKHPS